MEIERKWVAEAVPAGVCERTGTRIEQAYLTSERDGPEVRIRRRDGHCTLTVKSAGTLERTEVELAISGTDFAALWPLTNGRRLVKTRVEYPLSSDLVAEVDTFDDRALILVEVEFASGEQAREFVPPGWFGQDVTDDPAYKNRNLAR
jgi:adenylate cyclase